MVPPVDEAIKGFFSRLKWGGKEIPVVYAGPDRAHGEIRRYLAKRGRVSLEQAKEMRIPYPWCSVWSEGAEFDPMRFNAGRARNINTDYTLGITKSMRAPKPFKMLVQADLWCKDHRQAKLLETQLHFMFWDDETTLPMNFADSRYYREPYQMPEHMRIMGETRMWLKMMGALTDNSDLETQGQDREIRKTFSGEARFDLPHVPYVLKIARTLALSLVDESVTPPETLDTLTVQLGG